MYLKIYPEGISRRFGKLTQTGSFWSETMKLEKNWLEQ